MWPVLQVTGLYMGLAGFLGLVWFGYPIVWGFAEGSDNITVTAEVHLTVHSHSSLSWKSSSQNLLNLLLSYSFLFWTPV